MVSQKPETLKQTSDSLQVEMCGQRDLTMGHTVTYYSSDEMFSMLYFAVVVNCY